MLFPVSDRASRWRSARSAGGRNPTVGTFEPILRSQTETQPDGTGYPRTPMADFGSLTTLHDDLIASRCNMIAFQWSFIASEDASRRDEVASFRNDVSSRRMEGSLRRNQA
jgi:hypothetical protein